MPESKPVKYKKKQKMIYKNIAHYALYLHVIWNMLKKPTWIYDNCMYYKIYRFWVNNSLTKLRHCLSLHFCLILFGPPNFFISCQSKKKKLCIKQSKGGNYFNMSVWYAYQHIWNKYVYITMTSYNGTCSNKLIFITNSFELFIWICDSKILSIF